MGLDDTLRALIEDAYVAALDDLRWPSWCERFAHTLGGRASAFGVVDTATGAVRHRHLGGFSARACDEYAAGMAAIDPQTAFIHSIDRSTAYVDGAYSHCDDPGTAEYMRWQAGVAGVRSSLGAVVMLGGGRLKVGLVAHRGTRDGATPTAERAKLAAMLPHLKGALELGFLHAAKLEQSYWDGLLTSREEPAALIDRTGRLLRLTPNLEQLLTQEDGLAGTRGRLQAAAPAEDTALQALVTKVSGSGGSAGALRISRRSGRASYIVTAYPLPRRAPILAPADGAVAMVAVVDPARFRSGRKDLWRSAFGLSPRESELADLLMLGHSVESAAAVLGIAEATVRIHLRRLLMKTGTARQTELVRLLARIAPAELRRTPT